MKSKEKYIDDGRADTKKNMSEGKGESDRPKNVLDLVKNRKETKISIDDEDIITLCDRSTKAVVS